MRSAGFSAGCSGGAVDSPLLRQPREFYVCPTIEATDELRARLLSARGDTFIQCPDPVSFRRFSFWGGFLEFEDGAGI